MPYISERVGIPIYLLLQLLHFTFRVVSSFLLCEPCSNFFFRSPLLADRDFQSTDTEPGRSSQLHISKHFLSRVNRTILEEQYSEYRP